MGMRCGENIVENEMIYNYSLNDYGKIYSCTVYIVLLVYFS